MTREYNDQNKHFQTKHEEIKLQEIQKRDQISRNFEDHIIQIRQQMDDERVALRIPNDEPREGEPEVWENEVVKENALLNHKYEELLKEIAEKSELMASQLEGKEGSSQKMEAQIQQDLDKQEKNVEQQAQLYAEQTEQKLKEKEELQKILKDYKGKYAEFEKATKKSKQYYQNFEKEVRQQEQRKKVLQQQKAQLERKLNQAQGAGKKKGKKGAEEGKEQEL